ncbi:MAG TPA: DUF4123 domain-containing protein [Myxococcales bacterium]|nr:DUF4123 domain-containing protein [Myxococcales bacterium]
MLEALGSGQKFAVLDGARDGRVASLARGELVRCLYRGDLPREVSDAAPHLMRIWPGNEATDRFFKQGWGQSWGVLVAYSGQVKVLHRHLRQFLRVRLEDGRVLGFRWYDPRVLRVFLPTCSAAEMERFFGPVEAFAVEDEQPEVFHLFRRALRGFEQRRASKRDPSRLVRTWSHAEPPEPDGPLVLVRDRQLRALQERIDERYVDEAIRALRRKLPRVQTAGLSQRRLRDRCRDALDRAARYGLRGDDVFSFIALTFTVSENFDSRDPFREILSDSDIPGDGKLAALFDRVGADRWDEARRL